MSLGTTLITTPRGMTGKRVAERFANAQLPYRIASPSSDPAFNWHQADTWAKTLDGVTALYLVLPTAVAFDELNDVLRAFLAQCKQQGVSRIVMLSGRGEPVAQQYEQLVLSCGIHASIIRAAWFMQNFSERFLTESIQQGEWVTATKHVCEPFVDANDLADAAFTLLTEKHNKQSIYELTGSQLLSFDDVATLFSHKLQRTIIHRAVPLDDYLKQLKATGLAQQTLDLLAFLYGELMDGRNEFTSDELEHLLDRKPTTFADFIERTQKSHVWG